MSRRAAAITHAEVKCAVCARRACHECIHRGKHGAVSLSLKNVSLSYM